MGLIAGLVLGRPLMGAALLVFTLLLKTAQSIFVGGMVVRSRPAVLMSFLYPLRDLLGFLLWAASYFSNKLHWHGRIFELEPDGTMHLPGSPK